MRLSGFVAAAVLAAGAVVVAPEAHAQRNRGQSASLTVINYERVVNESALGRDMAAKLQQIQTQVASEGQSLLPEQQSLEQEAQRLQRARGNMTDEQVRNSSTLAPQFQQYAQRAREFELRRATLRGDYECSQAVALRDFRTAVMPIVQSVMASRGASAVMDASTAIYVAPENDITSAVIQQLDGNPNTRVANVARHPVAECLPQQQAQQPAPAPAQ